MRMQEFFKGLFLLRYIGQCWIVLKASQRLRCSFVLSGCFDRPSFLLNKTTNQSTSFCITDFLLLRNRNLFGSAVLGYLFLLENRQSPCSCCFRYAPPDLWNQLSQSLNHVIIAVPHIVIPLHHFTYATYIHHSITPGSQNLSFPQILSSIDYLSGGVRRGQSQITASEWNRSQLSWL